MQRTAETMDLEAQSVDQKWLEEQIRLAADELLRENWKHLWDENV